MILSSTEASESHGTGTHIAYAERIELDIKNRNVGISPQNDDLELIRIYESFS